MSEAVTTTETDKATTVYVVLAVDAETGLWRVAAKSVQARTPENAVKQVASTITEERVYVAVPGRSWKPVKVTPKVETTLVLEDA